MSPTYVWEVVNYFAVCVAAGSDNQDGAAVASGIRAVITGASIEFNYEYPCHSPSEQRWFIVRVTPFSVEGHIRVVVAHEAITERKLAEEALLKTNTQLLVLNRIIALTHTTLDPKGILNAVCRELTLVFQSPYVIAALVDKTSMFLRTMSEYRISERTASISLNISLVNNALAEYLGRYRIPLAVQDAQHDLRLESIRHLMFEGGIKSLLVVPLFVRQRLTGIVAVTKAETYEFSGEELTLAGALAQAVSQALENSLLHTSTTEQNNNLEQIVMARTAQLQRLNERMSAVLNNTSDAIVLVETNKIIENTNFAFDQMFGYGHDEMFGHSIDNLAHPDHQKHLFEAFRRVLQSHQTQQKQLVGVRKDGSVFDMDCTLVYVHDNEGHIVLTARDITHLKEVERMKDHFVSMVSHELKNPLNGIMVGASNLKNYYVKMDDDQCMGAIDRLNSGALAMAELIKGILNLARIDAGSLVRTEERIAMRPIVEKVIAELQAESEAKHQTISLNMDFAPDVLIGDSLDFTRIWHNLIGNASKYTPDGGKISVRLGTLSISAQSRPIVSENIQLESLKLPADMIAGDYLLCQIEDDGYGISSADLKQLFTRFFRGAAATGDIPGTGLGLALVRELLRFYGGEISVVSELTVGSCFSFWIKLEGIDVVV